MKALHVRRAFRILEERGGVEDRAIVSLLELGEQGCSLQLGPEYVGGKRERWVIANDGSVRQIEGPWL